MRFRRKLQWLKFGMIPFFLFSGCGDLEPDMQDTRTVSLNMDFHGKSSLRSSSSISAAELSQYNTHLILALPSWEYLTSTSSYNNFYSSFAQELMNTTDKKVSLEIPLNTQMKIFAFLFKENYSMYELFSGTREVGYYGESQPFSIDEQTNNLSLSISLQSTDTTTGDGDGTDPDPDSDTGTETGDTMAPIIEQVTAIESPTNDSTPEYTFASTKAGSITYGGSCYSSIIIADIGNNSIVFNALSDGYYDDCTVKVMDSEGNESNTLAIPPFTVNTTVPDTTAPTVSSIYPTDNQSNISISDNISVTFSEVMDSTSVTTNTDSTTCSGTFNVSSDNFSSCVQMSSFPTSSNSYKTFTLDPYDNLTVGTTYLTRVTTGVKDDAGNAMISQYATSSGFTTASSPVSDRWSRSLKGGNIVLSNNNLDATSQNTTHSWNSVYGENSYAIDDGGIYEWKIQLISVDNDPTNGWEMVIGVGFITEDEDNSSYKITTYLSSQTKGFGYIQQNGKKTSAGSSQSFLSAYELNDNITVRLDLDNNTLSFGKNNGDISVSHSSLPSDSGEKYRLAASIGDDGDKFRIISHTTNP